MKKNKALIVGGGSGIGLTIALQLLDRNYEKVYIVDKNEPLIRIKENIEFVKFNLLEKNYTFLDKVGDINTLIFTAGFGRIAPFENIQDIEIINNFKVNTISYMRILKHYYDKICNKNDFYCAVISSIAGIISSPLFSIYGATKAALCKFIESINIELEMNGVENRMLNVSPGSIKGTKFNNGINDINLTKELANNIINKMYNRETIYIPDYQNVYKSVIERYNDDPNKFGKESYLYKMKSGRVSLKPQVKIGYLSGTFDLFHIGHLNLLKRAKMYCDYLIVGVHKDASHKNKNVFVPFEERVKILESIRYVDKVIESLPEDDAVYKIYKYDYLFVGSDYKGTERFIRYENYFKDKNVQIIYFPYTKGTNSTQLRELIEKSK